MSSSRWFLIAALAYCAIAVSLAGPALIGRTSIVPEGYIDRDHLYRVPGERARLRPFGDATPMLGDFGRERAVGAGLHQGRIDTWNPWSSAGVPLWAEQGSPFFPTKLIYYLYPHHATMMAALAARLIVAALGMFFLARALGLAAPLALFCGALFEYSGILAEQLAFAASSGMFMLPWALLAARNLAAGGGGWGATAVGGIALGLAGLGGHPSFTLLVGVAFGAWLLGDWVRRRPPPGELARAGALAAASGVLAALIAAVVLLPFLELLWHSASYKDVDAGEESWRDRLDWTRDAFAAALLAPSLMTVVRDTILFHYWPYAAGASIGFAALLLAIAGAGSLREHWGAIVVAVLGVALTLAPPGLRWLHELPGVRFILPWYCYGLIVVPLCLAAGFGLQRLAAAPRRKLLLVPLALMFLCLLLVMLALVGGFDPLLKLLAGSGLYRKILRGDLVHLADWRLLISPAAGVAAVAAYLLLCRSGAARAAAAVAVIALLEAAAVRIPTVDFERSRALREGPSQPLMQVRALLAGGDWRFLGWPATDVAVPNSSLLFELRDFRGSSPLVVQRLDRYLDLAGAEPRAIVHVPATIRLPMLGLAAVKYILHSDGGELTLVENPFALPRFRVVHEVTAAQDERDAFQRLRGFLDGVSDAVPDGWPRRAIIEGASPEEVLRARAAPGSPRAASVRLVAEPDPQTIVLEAELEAPGFVVAADTFYPGWTATVDGVAAPIRPADLMFRALYVPAGKHAIVMRYRSSWLGAGAALTLIGLLLATALLVRERRLEQRTKSGMPRMGI